MPKEFYKLNEYPGTLPDPKLLPIEDKAIDFKDLPNTFSNGYILDIKVTHKDKKRLKDKVTKTISNPLIIKGVIDGGNNATILLSEPKYVYEGYNMRIIYVLFTPDGIPIGIQVKYYRYFRNRYPGCEFYGDDEAILMKAVKLGDKLVGLWMPIMLPPEARELPND